MQNNSAARVVILGTGGTIAGTAASPDDAVGYRAGQLGVDQLVAAVPGLRGLPLDAEQVAQLDSKDMDHATWQRLAQRVAVHLARSEVAGLVVTHGTDTLEETAWFLQRVLAPTKPVVLVAAMRPATALMADGPQNLLDAVNLARWPGAQGVLVVMAARVHGAAEVRKAHGYQVDAFTSGEAGPLARIEPGHRVQCWRAWPQGEPLGLDLVAAPVAEWPHVALLCSHAGLDAADVAAQWAALAARGCRGVVVEGTGNGTVHRALAEALAPAIAAGVPVWRASRCQEGVVGQAPGTWPSAGPLTPAKARVELMLRLLAQRAGLSGLPT